MVSQYQYEQDLKHSISVHMMVHLIRYLTRREEGYLPFSQEKIGVFIKYYYNYINMAVNAMFNTYKKYNEFEFLDDADTNEYLGYLYTYI